MAAILSLHTAQPSDSTELLEVTSPFDQSQIARLQAASERDIQHALATAHETFINRRQWLSPAERIEILTKTAEMMQQKAEHLASLAAREGGKPLADSRVEVARAIDGVKNCVEIMRTQAGREIPMSVNAKSSGKLAFTHHEPIGPVVAVSAFNHPLNLIVHQVAPAIATGCPVVVKPAETTPLSCYRLVELFWEAGLPKAWCQALVVNDLKLVEKLVADARVGFFTFIGSAKVGWALRSKLAPGTRCALEHGGSAPVIVHGDADLENVIPKLTKAGFYHAGQVCVSVQRIFAHIKIYDQLCERLVAAADEQKIGDPLDPETDVGPLIRTSETDRIDEWVKEAEKAGAVLLTGGKKLSRSTYACTVLGNPPGDVRVSQQEVFGPVVCVYPYEDLDAAIKTANVLPFSFQAAIFTRQLDVAMQAYTHLNASAVMVNEHTAFRVDWMPFGGLKYSGLGTGGIPYTMKEMQVEKMLVISSEALK